jgi:hypothetical protein
LRILVNFQHREVWWIHCLAEDARTLISEWVMVRTDATLLHLFRACGATPDEMDEIERNMKRWGGGSTFIDANEVGCKLLRIRPHVRSAAAGS